jgi:cardiolipin synthase
MTLANLLTVFRMVVIPFFIMAITYGRPRAALWLFLIAGITDSLDGFIARVWNQRTALGAFLDPMADKLMLTSAFVVMALPGMGLSFPIPPWLPVLTIARDVVIVLLSLVMSLSIGIRQFPPSLPGKLTTFIQISYIVGVLIQNGYGFPRLVVSGLMWAVALLTVFSGMHYIWRMKIMIRGKE